MDAPQVLLLDDEENILMAVQRLCFDEPFGILLTRDFQEALSLLEQHSVKVVISDQRMPDISGVDFLGRVKEKYPKIMRILLTGHADVKAAEDAINIGGVYRFINKPWDSEDLRSAIRQAIHHYDLRAENEMLLEATNKKNEELEFLNKKLHAMYESQKEFTSTVSHELRTPLASIKTALDIVFSGTPGPLTSDQEKFLGKAKSNVDRLNRLINDILDLTKLESGRMELSFQMCLINDIIRDVMEIQGQVARGKGLSVEMNLDETILAVPMDSDKVIQVLNNLIGNAIKFTEQGGISIVTKNCGDKNHVEVIVQDTGPGISADDQTKLFQKFQQLGDPATRMTGGTGLGLAICKEIIVRHGGKVWVESQQGKGSEFHFILPIEERRTV